MDKKNILFVINPIAGRGKQYNIDRYIMAHIDRQKFNSELIYTKYPKHAAELGKAGILDSMDAVVAVGGDGSVNEVARNLAGGSRRLGIIPMGSGNGLARHLKLPLDAVKAIKRINAYEHRIIDTATINGQLFLNVAGVGFDAEISNRFAVFGKRGFLSYFRLSVNTFRTYHPAFYRLEVDGKVYEKEAFLIAIANGSQYGNNASIAPLARLDDGKLDVCLVKPLSYRTMHRFSYHLFNKSLHLTNFCEFYQGQDIRIEQVSELAHYDGEAFQSGKHLSMKVQPASLNVLI